jgi:hypothetical protein
LAQIARIANDAQDVNGGLQRVPSLQVISFYCFEKKSSAAGEGGIGA